MKATDLMVGDYCLVKPSMMPIKVAAVHQKKVAYHAVSNKLNWVRESLLEPIPLTPEILEKNGFAIENDDTYVWRHESGLEKIIWFNGGCTTVVSVRCDSIYEGYCYDVHELQHALKICGIRKEIEL